MRVSSSVFTEIPSLKTIRSVSLSNGDVRFHHAPIFGLVCGLLGFDSETSKRAYMFITMRDILSVATRLNLVGPLGAAVLKHQVTFVAEELLKKWKNRGVDEACQISSIGHSMDSEDSSTKMRHEVAVDSASASSIEINLDHARKPGH
ncbi:urease accessory protein F [Tanacetum coccineum]